MELVLAVAAGVGVFWWLGRSPSGPTGPVAHEVARRATDMDDPDGTFMDGYVAGRLTERHEAGESVQQRRPRSDGLDPDGTGVEDGDGDDCAYERGFDGNAHDAMDDDW